MISRASVSPSAERHISQPLCLTTLSAIVMENKRLIYLFIHLIIYSFIQLNLCFYVINLCQVLCWTVDIQKKASYTLLLWNELLYISHYNKGATMGILAVQSP